MPSKGGLLSPFFLFPLFAVSRLHSVLFLSSHLPLEKGTGGDLSDAWGPGQEVSQSEAARRHLTHEGGRKGRAKNFTAVADGGALLSVFPSLLPSREGQ